MSSFSSIPIETGLSSPNVQRGWIYASVTDYELRGATESPEIAARRLRDCIAHARDQGSIVEFVQARDWTARRGEVPLERVRERLRAYRDAGLPLDFEGPLHTPRVDEPSRKRELNQRRDDGTPSPIVPAETDVEQRLRRWNAAQRSLDERWGPKTDSGQRRCDGAPAVDVAAGIARRHRNRGPERGR